MRIIAFLAGSTGRITRGLLGLVLIAVGVALGGGWWALAVVGLIPTAAAAFDVCLLAPLAHLPIGGRALRAKVLTH